MTKPVAISNVKKREEAFRRNGGHSAPLPRQHRLSLWSVQSTEGISAAVAWNRRPVHWILINVASAPSGDSLPAVALVHGPGGPLTASAGGSSFLRRGVDFQPCRSTVCHRRSRRSGHGS
jgi:hypothetical protein